MEEENKLQKLLYLFQNMTEIENSYLEKNLGEAYFIKSVTTELREIIMIFYFSTDLLRLSRLVKEDYTTEYYNLVYGKINDMKKNVLKNLKIMQSMCVYIKDVDCLRFVDESVYLINLIVSAVENSIDRVNY